MKYEPYILVTILCIIVAFSLMFIERRMEDRESEWQYKWSQVQQEKGIPCLLTQGK
mgnify:CR=1